MSPAAPDLPSAERGVALVITLIMLSVTLVMALAFLAVSRRERNSVSTTTDTATARLAADAALAAAQAQIAANILASSNLAAYSYGLLVSTNFQNSYGFVVGSASPTNVNYDYLATGGAVAGDNLIQNIANLWLLPRAPVFIKTNQSSSAYDFRFYLDLNRDTKFEGSGWQPQFGNNGGYLHPDGTEDSNPANVLTNFMNGGDPEWIGVLEHPDQPHGPNNHFIARYAFLAQPIGNSLDLNYIHNDATRPDATMAIGHDGFFRNQGVGSWELNLAAFFTDLNTNQWSPVANPYQYNTYSGGAYNSGAGFEDAIALLKYRYGGTYDNLASANQLFFDAPNTIPLDGIDDYSDGPLQTTINTNADFISDVTSRPWAGADNTNRFYSLLSDLFDPSKSSGGLGSFTNRLMNAGNGNSTYDRYTLYRLLDELGTDSAAESGKLNLNYSNAVVAYNNVGIVTNIYIIPGAETNLVPWTAQNFFIAAADRMLKLYTANWYATDPTNYLITYYGYIPTNYVSRTGFGVTNVSAFGMTNEVPSFGIMNIPVRMNGNFVYTPAVNRVLQLAANLYDASTNSFYPSVFRPIFERDVNGNVFITGYTNLYSVNGPNTVRDAGDPQLSPPYEVALLSTTTLAPVPNAPIADGNGLVNVYGVPWIIGTKKYLPGLNQFSLVNSAQFIRKLQVARNYVGGPIWTNQMIVMSISNNLGISFWNPYTNDYPTNYPGGLDMSIVVNTATRLAVTNSDWTAPYLLPLLTTNYVFRPSRWPGAKLGVLGNGTLDPNSFIVQQWANQVVTQSVYSFSAKTFVGTDQSVWETNRTELDLLPQFGLLTTNWVQSYIVDRSHVIDYVQLRGPINNGNLNSALKDPNYEDETGNRYLWSTNIWQDGSTISWGIVNQIDISSTPDNPPPSASWKNPGVIIPGITDPREASWIFFGAILKPNSVYQYAVGGNTNNFYTNLELAVQAPYTATRTVYVPYLYQVNDPLVHYLVNDLDAGKAGVWAGNNVHANGIWDRIDNESTTPFPTPPRTEIIKGRYQPWGIGAQNALLTTTYNFDNAYNLVYKDPLIWSADSWSFLTNKYPTAGWVGRVHRGTPWQTVYLKAHNVLHTFIDNKRTVDSGTNTWMAWTGDYNILDAANSGPLQDRLLFDVFTTAPNDNATRGQLSVNQTHLAAWSALFSGMVVLSNSVPDILFNNSKTQPSNSWLVVSPAGPNGLNSALGNLVTNINNSRAIYTNVDGVVGTFEHKGDILSVVALTEQSPFLNWNNTIQQQKGISDEVYEWLPQQMMSLLKCPTSPRYVVYCYGQTLKPAPDSRVTSSGTYFGLVTNYQVVAESAARAVIRLDRHATAAGTNYTTTVESYNVLPPD